MQNEQAIIDEHKKMVIMTGNLSDFQLTNLKNWPFILFDKEELLNVSINYDFTKEKNTESESLYPGKITYDFHFKKGIKYKKKDFLEKVKNLEFWVKFMFWKETEVEFLIGGVKCQ